MHCLFRFSFPWFFVVLLFFLPIPLFGEEKEPSDPYERGPLFLNRMDIKGSALNPGISFQIPWKPPESVEEGEEVMVRGNLQNLLVPLEPEDFEWAARTQSDGIGNEILENRGNSSGGEE